MAGTKNVYSNIVKARKVVNVPVRNIERAKQKLLIAVSKLFTKERYTGLKVKRIAEQAMVVKLIFMRAVIKTFILCFLLFELASCEGSSPVFFDSKLNQDFNSPCGNIHLSGGNFSTVMWIDLSFDNPKGL